MLTTEALTLRWPSGFVAGPLTFTHGPGVVHLQGPNGVGKSTLLRCLAGDHRAATGRIAVGPDGLDPRTSVEARRRVSFVAAEPELPAFLTVDEAWRELAALRGKPRWDGAALRDRLGVPGALPLGHCSAGQRRLAELLAGLAGDPAVLLLDEPFANLDPAHRDAVTEVVTTLRAEHVLVVTHHGQLPVSADLVVSLPVGGLR
jgi:ABC-type multidrug transport system ATPase subunit